MRAVAASPETPNLAGGVDSLPRRTGVICSRLYGLHANSAGAYTMHMTRRAPAHFDAVRVILAGKMSSANVFRASIAPSARYGNGYVPKDAADASIAPTSFTFGTISPGDLRNPGCCADSAEVFNAFGSPVGASDLIEGRIESDWLSLGSLDRVDDAAAPPLFMFRLYGIDVPATSINESHYDHSNPFRSVDPEFYAGYWAADNTTVADPGTAPAQWGIPGVELVFCLRGQRLISFGVAGDSIEHGWIAASAIPQFGGNINGWPRKLAHKLNLAGIPTTYACYAQTGNKSRLFHERAYNALLATPVGLTHFFIKPWSTNESADGLSSVAPACARTNQLIALCEARGVVPIIIRPWAGQSNAGAIGAAVQAYCDRLATAGVTMLDARHVVSDDPLSDSLREEFKTRNADGSAVDGTHLNEAGQEAVAQFVFSNRASFGLV